MTKAKKWVRGILAVAIVGGAGAAVVKTEVSDAYAQGGTNRLFAVWRLDNETTSACSSAANMRKVVATRSSEEASIGMVPTVRNGVAVSSGLYTCGGNSIAGQTFYHHGQVQVATGDVLNATGMFGGSVPSGGDSISSADLTGMGNCKLKLCASSNCDGRSDLNGFWAVDDTNGTRTVCTYQGDWY